MSIATLILGESGAGKTSSLRHVEPEKTLLIQSVKKPLPFKSGRWSWFDKESNPAGNIIVQDGAQKIVNILRKTRKEIIIIDDFQYILINEFMRRILDKESSNSAFAKYNEIAKNAWDILMTANALEESKRIYILGHTQETESGRIKIRTIGKLLDDKINIEGLLSIVLRASVINGNYLLNTQNNGMDTVKSPMGLFEDSQIPNDLAAIDRAICDYYGIEPQRPQTTQTP